MNSSRKRLGQQGVALLIALMAITFLVTMTVQLMVDVDGQVEDAAGLGAAVAAENAVTTGLSLVQALLYSDQQTDTYDSLHDGWATIEPGQFASLTGDVSLSVEVVDLSGRLQVNALLEENIAGEQEQSSAEVRTAEAQEKKIEAIRQLWQRLLLSGTFAIEDEQQVDELLDAIRDWIDADDDSRAFGAENAYYQSLDPPYQCRNQQILVKEELLLIKGMTPALYYGDEEHEGLEQYITVAGNDGKLNLNTAPVPVLLALHAELESDMVNLLTEFREEEDNRELLADPAWYKEVGGFPGDITLEEELLTTTAKAFLLTITGERQGIRRQGIGVLLRNDNHEQKLQYWGVQ